MPKKPAGTAKQGLSGAALVMPCKAWENAAGQKESTARLSHLPPGISFSDAVGEPIYYDTGRQLIHYRGFMCQASYNYLHKLSLDPEYETAIDQIYMASAQGEDRGIRRWGILTVGFLIGLAATWAGWLWLH
jgi:hypothetical protein